eukprot:scaffold21924_cov62-Phaeocystis_antarctica.AAC.5
MAASSGASGCGTIGRRLWHQTIAGQSAGGELCGGGGGGGGGGGVGAQQVEAGHLLLVERCEDALEAGATLHAGFLEKALQPTVRPRRRQWSWGRRSRGEERQHRPDSRSTGAVRRYKSSLATAAIVLRSPPGSWGL